MSPIPKANEPRDNPQPSDDVDGLESPPQGYNSVASIVDGSSSDDDSDDGGGETQYGGYQLLSQDPEPLDEDDDEPKPELECTEVIKDKETRECEQPSASSTSSSNTQQPDLPQHLAKLLPAEAPTPDATTVVTHIDTAISLEQRKNQMANDDQIRAAMAGFSLPMAVVPSWARAVQEGDWKQQLVARIQNKHDKQQRTDSAQKGYGGKR